MSKPSVFLGIPVYNGNILEGHINAIFKGGQKMPVGKLQIRGYSCLTNNFNHLLCGALNERKNGITHFALLHSDIIPCDGWLDILYKGMQETKADIISAIVPIKDGRGLTSTALDTDLWRPRRLTLHEVHNDYPKTFTQDDLLLNTGCMLVDIRNEWIEGIRFRFEDRIEKINGNFVADIQPEDWLFSRDAKKLGARLAATSEVRVDHIGTHRFSNDKAWGSWLRDKNV